MRSKHRNQKERRFRLMKLLEVLRKHKEAEGKAVRLNGEERFFNMSVWDCGTSACALGSYAMTPYGKKFFKPERLGIGAARCFLLKENQRPWIEGQEFSETRLCGQYAHHFNITLNEAEAIFLPEEYRDEYYITPGEVIRKVKRLLGLYEQGRGGIQKIKRRHMYNRFGFSTEDLSL